jgi:uncharacterized membrane protein YhaH (DUF805 family)
MNYYVHALKNYAQFQGRARRSEFIYFMLFNFFITLGLTLIDRLIGTTIEDSIIGILALLYSLSILIPYIALFVRRLHDTGKSGWLALLLIVPCVGNIVTIVYCCIDSQPGTNPYGPNPKEPSI